MRKILLLVVLILTTSLVAASPIVAVSDIRVFQDTIPPAQVSSVSVLHLHHIGVIVKKIDPATCGSATVQLLLFNTDDGITISSTPISAISFNPALNPIPDVDFSKDSLHLNSNIIPGNYSIQASAYCGADLQHQKAEVFTILPDSSGSSVPEIPFVFGIGIALASCALLFGQILPNFRIKKS